MRAERAPAVLSAAALALALFGGAGCGAAGDTPVLAIDTESVCELGSSCLSDGAEEYEVDGLRVLHKQLPGHPLVALRVLIDAEPAGARQVWSEELALALLGISGPRRFHSASWDTELLRLGATLGAYRGTDYAVVGSVAPLPNWRALSELLAEALYDPNLDVYDLEHVRDSISRSFGSERDDPGSAAGIDAWSRLFQGDPRNLERERLDALGAVTRDDLAAAWRGMLNERRVLIALVGDVSRRDVEQAVRSIARALHTAGASEFPPDTAWLALPQPEVAVLPYPESPTWYIASYFRGPAADSPDYPPLELGLTVLGQRLFSEVRDARGLAYSTGAELMFFRSSVGTLWLTTQAPREALPIARQILAELSSAGPSEGELAAARAGIRTRLLSDSSSPPGLAYTLSDWAFTAGRAAAVDDYLAALEQAQPASVAAALDTYLKGVKTAAAGGGSPLTEADLSTLFVRP